MTKEEGLKKVKDLVTRFSEQLPSYKKSEYNETQTRRDFIDPFFKALGWDIDNKQGFAESYREVIHEDRVKVGKATKAPDYSFRLGGGKRLFFVEAKKPSVYIKDDLQPAYQVRRYGWSAKLNVSVITDFEEFAIYDCTKKPNPADKPSVARVKYITYDNYETEWDFIWNTFSKEAVLKGTFDKFIVGTANKKGTATVDKEFLLSLDQWRTLLAETISKENKQLDEDELNFVVQQTLDRIIFLRISEDRSIEPYGSLRDCLLSGEYYQNLLKEFKQADNKYNSGLFDFKKDKLSPQLNVNNKTLKTIINELYYPICPYEFSVLSVEILGSAYEQFLGKTICINNRGKAVIELKPEVRKAGGVYYTPQYIVNYIVQNSIGKLTENKTPKSVAQIKIIDPACGSGSFLIGAYQYLLTWHKDYYLQHPDKKNPLTADGNLTTSEKKKILLNNIYGVDIDTNAVEVTKLSLLLKCMEGETHASIANQITMFKERVLPTLDENIKSGNSLIDLDYYDNQIDFGEERKIKPFSWQKAFPSVFKNGGFDVVVGNPPYGATFNTNEKSYLTTKYKVAEGNYESFSFFIEKSNYLMNQNGILGFIIPDTWFTLKSSIKLRKFVIDEFNISEIQMLNEKVFTSAKVDVCTFLISKSKKLKSFDVLIFDKDATDIEMQKGQYVEKHTFSKADIIQDSEFSFRFKQNKYTISLVAKMSSAKYQLEDFCLIGSGCKPYEVGKGIPPQSKKMLDEKVYTSSTKRDKTYRLLLRGADISRYSSIQKNDEWLSYGEWLAAPRNPNLFKGDRLLFQSIRNPKLKRRLVGTFVNDNSVNNNSITNIVLKDENKSLKFFLGVLNSNLINWYFAVSYNIVNIDPRYLKMIPIPEFNQLSMDIHNQISTYVDQLLQLNQDLQTTTLESKKEHIKLKIEYNEEKINAKVYELYNLTKEEINIIETN